MLYTTCGNLLAQNARIKEAIELLQQGIQRIPSDKELHVLYINCASLLARSNKVREAIAILREGLSIIPFNKYGRHRLAENAMLFCLASKNDLILEEILAGNGKNSLEPEMLELGKVLSAQLKGNWQEAAEIAHQARTTFHNLLLLTEEVFSWLCAGDLNSAEKAIQSFTSRKSPVGHPINWLKAFIAIKKKDYQLAEEIIIAYLDRPLQANETIDRDFLLYLWDTSVDFKEGINIAFNFPTLPPSLTGLETSITRQQNDVNVLPNILNGKNNSYKDTLEIPTPLEITPPLHKEQTQEQTPIVNAADVLIVTVTKVESRAVMQVFEGSTGHEANPQPINNRIYFNLGTVNGARVVLTQSEMGTSGLGASLLTVHSGIDALSPAAVIMVGIAFGINEDKQSIGDILVTEQLRPYELQRLGNSGEDNQLNIILRGDKPHASPWLINHFKSTDLFWNGADVHFGVMLTGEKLVDNVDFRERLHDFESEAIGGEMEGAGLYVACQEKKVDWILVKGICDWADGNKAEDKEIRQQKAAQNSAEFVLESLKFAPITKQN
ncbi:phosphorylase family protein [Mastigocoleus testarum]|uniref:phosphorylase family protein n=1 Tax=Mastigocoleus testarum TaxID=996925 RepID=UPI0004048325|nr:hypothetical protein [Mastigocoleus testarum]